MAGADERGVGDLLELFAERAVDDARLLERFLSPPLQVGYGPSLKPPRTCAGFVLLFRPNGGTIGPALVRTLDTGSSTGPLVQRSAADPAFHSRS